MLLDGFGHYSGDIAAEVRFFVGIKGRAGRADYSSRRRDAAPLGNSHGQTESRSDGGDEFFVGSDFGSLRDKSSISGLS